MPFGRGEPNTQVGKILGQVHQQVDAMDRESKALGKRLSQVEKILGSQDVPWERVVEMFGKTEESIQIQVRREMAAQVRKMMEVMMAQMLEEKLRQSQKEEHFDKWRNDIEICIRQQLCTILGKIEGYFLQEKIQREFFAREVQVFGGTTGGY